MSRKLSANLWCGAFIAGCRLTLAFLSLVMPVYPQRARVLPRPGSPVERIPEWSDTSRRSDDKYVYFDSAKTEYVLRFPERLSTGEAGNTRFFTTRFQPEFVVEPSVAVKVSTLADGTFRYEYTVRNAPSAPAPIRMYSVVVPAYDATIKLSHPKWVGWGAKVTGFSVAAQAALFSGKEMRTTANMGRFVTWMSSTTGEPVRPGMQESGFCLESRLLPGITTAYAGTGRARRTAIELPTEVIDQLAPVSNLEDMYKTAVTIGPRFDATASTGKLAQNYLADLRRLLTLGYVSQDSRYVKELLRVLQGVSENAAGPVSINVQAKPRSPLEQGIQQAVAIIFSRH